MTGESDQSLFSLEGLLSNSVSRREFVCVCVSSLAPDCKSTFQSWAITFIIVSLHYLCFQYERERFSTGLLPLLSRLLSLPAALSFQSLLSVIARPPAAPHIISQCKFHKMIRNTFLLLSTVTKQKGDRRMINPQPRQKSNLRVDGFTNDLTASKIQWTTGYRHPCSMNPFSSPHRHRKKNVPAFY